jgi:hypothetical protein
LLSNCIIPNFDEKKSERIKVLKLYFVCGSTYFISSAFF